MKQFILLITLLLACVTVWLRVPYERIVAAKIREALVARGLEVQSLMVAHADNTQMVLQNIILGKDTKLHIRQLSAAYSLRGLSSGKLDALTIEGLTAGLYRKNNAWQPGGLEPLMQNPPASSAAGTNPFSAEWIRALLPDRFTLTQASFTIQDPAFALTIPLQMDFTSAGELKLHISSSGIAGDMKPYGLTTGKVQMTASLNEKQNQWHGTLEGSGLTFTNAPQPLPALDVSGNFTATAQMLTAHAHLQSKDAGHKADIRLRLPMQGHEPMRLSVQNVQIPWAGGSLKIKSIVVPAQKAPIRIPLELRNVDLAQLLAMAGEHKISGTGRISGMFPIVVMPDGKLGLETGSASAAGGGLISVSPETLPGGDNAQMRMVRAALQNFHYSALTIRVLSEPGKTPVIQLNVAGSNPDAWGGRAVNLNVNLSGDLLSLLQQSLLPMQSPDQWIKQGDHP